MQSPSVSLSAILKSKESLSDKNNELSRELGRWLSEQLDLSGEDNQLFDCNTQFYSYSRVTLQRNLHGIQATLEVKIGEVTASPFYFADVRLIGQYYRPMLPISGPLETDEDKTRLLNYIADFILGVRSGEIEKNPRFSEIVRTEYAKPRLV